MRRFALLALTVGGLVGADQITKALALSHLKGTAALAVIPGFFDLAYVENRGCAWGMFQNHVWPLALFGLVALGVLIWKRKAVFGEGMLARFSEPMLYAGIIGNLADRIFRGYVIDFFDFHWQAAYHFPCFNIADVCICVAAGLMVLASFLCGNDKNKEGE